MIVSRCTEKRFIELQESLGDTAVLSNPTRLVAASKESGQLEPLVSRFRQYKSAARQVEELTVMAAHKEDGEMAELAAAELPEARAKADALLEALKDEFVAAEDNLVDSFFLIEQVFKNLPYFQTNGVTVFHKIHTVDLGQGVADHVCNFIHFVAANPHSTALYLRTSSLFTFRNISW